jgi:hypothetical protein
MCFAFVPVCKHDNDFVSSVLSLQFAGPMTGQQQQCQWLLLLLVVGALPWQQPAAVSVTQLQCTHLA